MRMNLKVENTIRKYGLLTLCVYVAKNAFVVILTKSELLVQLGHWLQQTCSLSSLLILVLERCGDVTPPPLDWRLP